MKKIAIAMLFAGSTLLMADGAALFVQGMDAAKLEELMKGYKAGTLNQHGMGALMNGQVKAMSDEDIKAVAEYISGLK